ncbi:NmrA family NAD(P)-binding protein [Klugiella xanthotipulae]|uniref:Uncharacterized protein YbjT (DUF2867 family) n=1 Tax=Klugiella xanthotipulae TaxID=244735 RepID=A0A543HY49_9MICO|nr:NmrA family NAD(P)-binding protein [Klugiella xanthotipulae]TQM63261.1 uncharacterized protein YbjT (DUF2867 family) [Klugiella xanthotipulae]
MTISPVLVTGATGTVGAHVTEGLLAAGLSVRAAGRTAQSVRSRFGDRVEAIEFDFTDPATWAAACDGVTSMFLMRPPQLGAPKKQMLPALEYARSIGVKFFVFLSLQGAEGNKIVPHAVIEAWLRDTAGVDYCFVRPSFFMQNLLTTHLGDIRDRGEILIPAGTGRTAFVDAIDVAAVASAALLRPDLHSNVAYTPTGPAALTYTEIAAELSRVLGRTIRYSQPGVFRFARHARRTLRMPWGMVGVTCAIYTIARWGKAGGLTDDVRLVTGRSPGDFGSFARREREVWSR